MNNKKILVTGGCGYQGSKLIPILLKKSIKVTALDTQWFGSNLKKHKNLTILKKNIVDIEKKDLKNISHIIHLASVANDPMGDLNPSITWETSCIGTMRMMDLALKQGVKKVIYASSSSVYGLKKEKRVHENLELKPISIYNKAKMITERILLSYKDKMNISIIRPATVCGLAKRMRFDVSVNMLTLQALKNKKITIFGGSQIRPNIHIDDLLDIYLMFLSTNKKYNGIFNAGFENLSILQIAKVVNRNINSKIKIIKNIKDVRSYRVDSSKILKLGFKPKKNIKKAIIELKNKYMGQNLSKLSPKFFSIDWLKKNEKFKK